MYTADGEYREERICTLRSVERSSLESGESATDELDACAGRLRQLIGLGESLVETLEIASLDKDLAPLHRWLRADIAQQRALLKRIINAAPLHLNVA